MTGSNDNDQPLELFKVPDGAVPLSERIDRAFQFIGFIERLRGDYPDADQALWEMMTRPVYDHYLSLLDERAAWRAEGVEL